MSDPDPTNPDGTVKIVLETLKTKVRSGDEVFTFCAGARKASCKEDFFLDPVLFYHAYGGKIPSGEHWEIEILEPGAEFFVENKLHVARSPRSTNPFMCYPASLPTIERAKALFKVWCVGTVLTIKHGIDLNRAYKGNDEEFFAEMSEKYGITLEECE